MYTCVYVCIHKYMYVEVHTHQAMYTRARIHAIYVCIFIYVHVYICTFMPSYTVVLHVSRPPNSPVKVIQMISTIGEENGKFQGYRTGLVTFYCENGGREARVSWAKVDESQINYLSEQVTGVHEPDDQLWDYDYYVSIKGDPAKNGLGHVETWDHGQHEVRVPSAPIRLVKRAAIKTVQELQFAFAFASPSSAPLSSSSSPSCPSPFPSLPPPLPPSPLFSPYRPPSPGEEKRVLHDGSGSSGDSARAQEILGELSAIIELPRATGAYVPQASSPAPPPPAPPPAMSPPQPKASGADGSGAFGGLSLGFSLAAPPPAPEPKGRGRGGKQTRRQQQPGGAPPGGAPPGGAPPGVVPPRAEPEDDRSKPGPKSRDLLLVATRLAAEFKDSDIENNNYFGDMWKNHSRYCKRLQDDIDAKVMTLPDADPSNVAHQKARKVIAAITAVCKQIASGGYGCEEFARVMDEQAAYGHRATSGPTSARATWGDRVWYPGLPGRVRTWVGRAYRGTDRRNGVVPQSRVLSWPLEAPSAPRLDQLRNSGLNASWTCLGVDRLPDGLPGARARLRGAVARPPEAGPHLGESGDCQGPGEILEVGGRRCLVRGRLRREGGSLRM